MQPKLMVSTYYQRNTVIIIIIVIITEHRCLYKDKAVSTMQRNYVYAAMLQNERKPTTTEKKKTIESSAEQSHFIIFHLFSLHHSDRFSEFFCHFNCQSVHHRKIYAG